MTWDLVEVRKINKLGKQTVSTSVVFRTDEAKLKTYLIQHKTELNYFTSVLFRLLFDSNFRLGLNPSNQLCDAAMVREFLNLNRFPSRCQSFHQASQSLSGAT